MKHALALATALAVAAGMAGCGDDSDGSTQAYCDGLKSIVDDFGALEKGNYAQVDAALGRLQEVGKDAPSDIKDEWETITAPIEKLRDGLEEAGMTFKDLEGVGRGKLPEGVDQSDLMELATTMQEFSVKETQQAGDAIERHAKSECGIDLNKT